MIGRTLGNYRIVEQIGLGGMATVYKAYDPDTDRYVAIKVLPEHFSTDPEFRQRFQREAKAIAKLEHLHILPLFAYGQDQGIAYMVMRYLPAGSLTERIEQGPLPLDEASRLLEQLAGALDYAHAHGVLHRDVKPSNILLDADGNAFLTDFGIAKMVEATLDLTAGGILGTPAYMSPEQCRGSKDLTPASDIYALGIVLYEMVTGRAPFQAETPIALIHMQPDDPLPLPRRLRPDLPEAAERVILKALAKAPESRYQTCGAMAAAFAQATAPPAAITEATLPSSASLAPTSPAINGATLPHGTAAEKISTEGTTGPVPGRRRWPMWAVGLLGLVIVVGLLAGAMAAGLLPDSFGISKLNAALFGAEPAGAPRPFPKPIAPNLPPPRALEVKPCAWDELGSGLCLFPAPDGRPIKLLKDVRLELVGPASWRPDGQQIAFAASEPGENPQKETNIYVVNADGTGLTELPNLGNDLNPAWSPDGDWLAFHSNCNLAIMHPDGSHPTLIWGEVEGQCSMEPQWSPDGQWLVDSILLEEDGRWRFPMSREVWVITRDGAVITPVAVITHEDEACLNLTVAFSPDGRQVAYVDGQCRAWVVNADGSGQPKPLKEFPFWWTSAVLPLE